MRRVIEVRVEQVALPHGPRETMARLRGGGGGGGSGSGSGSGGGSGGGGGNGAGGGSGHYALLESAPGVGSDAATWSYVAGPAVASLYTDATGVRLARAGRVETMRDDPFSALEAVLPDRAPRVHGHAEAPAGLDFVGGWIGLLGYDTARHLVRLPTRALADAGVPDMWWLAVDQVLAHHHPSGTWWQCTARGPADAWPWTDAGREAAWARTLALAAGPRPARGTWRAGPLVPGLDRAAFETGVDAIRATIAAGGCLQVNLTRRIDAAFAGDPWTLYEDLARANPAPHGAYLEGPGFALASCSPERFLRLRGRAIEARPIKGTAARGADPAQDEARRAWLAASAKNRAENLMIVDLMRNDLGRVATPGSVQVPSLFALEPHASVWQMVSTVEAQLRAGLGPVDLLRACWPPGSMTGAPKLAAMQMIEALEPTRRGPYAGSIGFLDCRGHLDLSVVIRSAVVAGARVSVQIGGGIVADSDPGEEWEETVAKGARLLSVLGSGGTTGARCI